MKKQRYSVCVLLLALFALLFASCADALNEKFPEKSEELATAMGVDYGNSSSQKKEKGYSYELSGKITASDEYDIWRFKATSYTNYAVSWTNGSGARMAVSASTSSSYFSSSSSYALFSDATSSPSSKFSVYSSGYVYIKVAPYNASSSNTGSYTIRIAGGSEWINLSKYDSYAGTSSSEASATITTGSKVPSSAWYTGSLTSANSYNVYSFYASYGTTYRVFWDDYSDGGTYYYASSGADVTVTASSSSSDFSSSSYVYTALQDVDSGYSNGVSLTPAYSGYVYLKVAPYSSSSTHATGSYRLAVTTGSSSVSISYYTTHITAVTASDVTTWTEGTFSSSGDYTIYSFYASYGTSYSVFWDDYYDGSSSYYYSSSSADIIVSASSSPTNFTSSVYYYFSNEDKGYSTGKTISPSYSGTIYLKVQPYSSSHAAGSFRIAVVSKTTSSINSVSLTEYDTYSASSSISASDVTYWTTGTLSSSSSYKIYSFYAYSGYTYTVFWDDHYQGSTYYYSSSGADVKVSASSSPTNFTSSSYCYFSDEDYGYSTGKTITPSSSGYIYLKVQPYSTSSSYPTGSFRIGVVRGTSSGSASSVSLSTYY